MMSLIECVNTFFKQHHLTDKSILLALSGGSDSMALFHSLLALQKKYPFKLVIAHVDHGWRPESGSEAEILHAKVIQEGLPFYLKTLDPSLMQGNLEAACRTERYQFFSELCSEHQLEGVMTAHHGDDQAETILKRVLEGAPLAKLSGLQSSGKMDELLLLRPLLPISKKEISAFLDKEKIDYFDDKTNSDVKFLRAKMRQQILPWLSETFGKNVQSALTNLGQEAKELRDYLDVITTPLIDQAVRGPSGLHLDLSHQTPPILVIKSIIRRLCEQEGFIPSRQIIDQAAHALLNGEAHKSYAMGSHHLRIDRKHISIPSNA